MTIQKNVIRRARRFALAAAILAVVVSMASNAALAAKRVALVVGNSAYVNIPRLDNPKNDAKLMADTLRGLGFTLIGNGAQLDLDKAHFDSAVQGFGEQLQGADVGLFYYAGHGLQVRGANYLVPVGANPTKEADVDFQMLDANLVLRQMEGAGAKLNLVILDACRNNPFGGRGLRAAEGGLAQMRAPEGTLISFATQPGNVAQDGADGNRPYTKALAQTIKRPGLDVFQTFNEVGLAVMQSTGDAQQPWVSTSPIKGSFFFGGAAASPASPPPGPAVDEITWSFLKNTTDVSALRQFIDQFAASPRRPEAQARVAALERTARERAAAEAAGKTVPAQQNALKPPVVAALPAPPPPAPSPPLAAPPAAVSPPVASARVYRSLVLKDTSEIRTVDFSPDGARVVSAGDSVKLWDAETGKPIRTFGETRGAAAFSGDGRRLVASAAYNVPERTNALQIWDVETGRLIRTLPGHHSYIESVAYAPDGRRVASGGGDNLVALWDADSGRLLATLEGHQSVINALAFSPDSRILASGSADNTARLWDVETGRLRAELKAHTMPVMAVAFATDGKQLVTASSDDTVKLWDIATGQVVRTINAHSTIYGVDISPDGRLIAVGCTNKTITLYETDTGRLVRTLRGHTQYVHRVMFSPDGHALASASDDKTVRIWPLDTDTGISRR